MATSGTLTSWVTTGTTNEGNSYAGAHYSFEWTSSVKSPGVTTVSWTLWSRGRYSSPRQLWHNIYVNTIVNGTTTNIYTGNFAADGYTAAQYGFNDIERTSGSFDVTHATDGSGSFQVYFKFACYAYLQYYENTETATLDINRATFTLTLSANGGSGGGTQTLSSGVATAINAGTTATKTNYKFVNWNTKSDGSGTNYAPGASITITKDTTLYANWTYNYYTVTYNGNGNTSGTVPNTTEHYNQISSSLASSSGLSKQYTVTYNGNGGTATVSSATATFTANGWNSNAAGTGTHYSSGGAVTGLTTTAGGNVTLYVDWSGGSVTAASATYDGYRFIGWNTAADGSGAKYSGGTAFTPTGNMTLYAQWASSSSAGNAVYIKVDGEWKLSTSA